MHPGMGWDANAYLTEKPIRKGQEKGAHWREDYRRACAMSTGSCKRLPQFRWDMFVAFFKLVERVRF